MNVTAQRFVGLLGKETLYFDFGHVLILDALLVRGGPAVAGLQSYQEANMSSRLGIVIVFAGMLVAFGAPVWAHHSFSAVYDGNKPITLRGKVSKLGWSNPHSHIYVDVTNPEGKVVTWEIESAGASNLLRAGLRREDFIGAEVIIRGYLAKDGSPAANASSFTLVDSKKEYVSDEAAKQ